MKADIRWMIRRDFPEILAIEQAAFPQPWNEKAFLHALQNRNTIGMVAEVSNRVVGYMVYELLKSEVRLLNFAVCRDWRRLGVGRAMVEKLIGKLSAHRRRSISIAVRETNLDAQLFFRFMGFECVAIDHEFYTDTGEDAYRFVYTLGMTHSGHAQLSRPKSCR